MKKIALLLLCTLILSSCDMDDSQQDLSIAFAEVTDADLPEAFEFGKTYTIEVTYVLPDACHNDMGVQVLRGGQSGNTRRDIYVMGIASFNASLQQCNRESTNLEQDGNFTINIDEMEEYTFYLWKGVANNENQYTTVEVPVILPGENDE